MPPTEGKSRRCDDCFSTTCCTNVCLSSSRAAQELVAEAFGAVEAPDARVVHLNPSNFTLVMQS